MRILMGQPKYHHEFIYTSASPADVFLRERLFESFRCRSNTHHVRIRYPRCAGKENSLWAKTTSVQAAEQLTWATLFVNSNYACYKVRVIPLFSNYTTFLVCHRSANLAGLPFIVYWEFKVDHNAWKLNFNLAHHIAEYILRENIRGAWFLFCAGPFSKILAHHFHTRSAENTCLDVGSTLDPSVWRKGIHAKISSRRKTANQRNLHLDLSARAGKEWR